jgi:hypothetical protein
MKSDVNHLDNKHSINNSECSTMQVFDVLQVNQWKFRYIYNVL